MISTSEDANRLFSDLFTPGTPSATPTPASATIPRNIQNLPPDALRRGGRCTSGSSRVAGGDGVVGDGFVREKFMEGLPLIIGHDAEIAIEGKTLDLILLPVHHQLDLQRHQTVLEVD